MVQQSTLSKWRAIVARHDSSGLSIKEFAESEGLNPRTLSWWRWKVGQEVSDSEVEFAEVTVVNSAASTVVLAFDELAAHVVVDRDTNLELLRDVLVALS